MAQRSKTVLKTYFETGKRPTQAQFGDLIDSLAAERPFRNYVALLSQTSINHPTSNILENNTGEDFFWSRESAGVYKVLLPTNISINNIFISLSNQFRNNNILGASTKIESTPNGNYLYIKGINDGELFNTSIEIRFYYTSLVDSTSLDIALARYTPYFKKNELRRDGNLLLSPYKFYNSYNGGNSNISGINSAERILLWKKMSDEYIILPEIFDGKKNPHAYNLRTRQFSCAYSYKNSTLNPMYSINYLKDCVKQARRSGATECVIDLGSDLSKINDNKIILKQVLIDLFADRGMNRVTLIVNGQVNNYTISELSV
jgi:hypothetical protein